MENLLASQACIDDTFLVREVQNGNHLAFEELVQHHDRAVLSLALRLTGSESDAQDIYQEAFLRAYKKLGIFATNMAQKYRLPRVRTMTDWTRSPLAAPANPTPP